MKIAVFGASGFIGRNLINFFMEKKIDFIGIGRTPLSFNRSLNYIQCNVLDKKRVEKLIADCSHIVHLAASSINESFKDPIENMKINIEGTLNILEAAKKINVKKIIYMSTIALFDKLYYNPVDEKHPCHPKSPYGVAKLACENYLDVYQHLYNLDYVVLRLSNVYGPFLKNGLIPFFYNCLVNDKAFTVFGDGTARRDYIYVEDVVKIIHYFLNSAQKNEIVNVGSGNSTSVNDVIDISMRILGKRVDILFKEERKGEIPNFNVDITKLQTMRGKSEFINIKDGLKRMFKWFGASDH